MAAGAVVSIRVRSGAIAQSFSANAVADGHGRWPPPPHREVLRRIVTRDDTRHATSSGTPYRPLRTSASSLKSVDSQDSVISAASTTSTASTISTTCSDAAFASQPDGSYWEAVVDWPCNLRSGRRCLAARDGELAANRLARLQQFLGDTRRADAAEAADRPSIDIAPARRDIPRVNWHDDHNDRSFDSCAGKPPEKIVMARPTGLTDSAALAENKHAAAQSLESAPAVSKVRTKPVGRRLMPRFIANMGHALWSKLLCVAGPTMLRCAVLDWMNHVALSAIALAALTYAAFGLPVLLAFAGLVIDTCRGQMTWRVLAARSVSTVFCIALMGALACCGMPPALAPQLVALVSYCLSRDALQSMVRIVNRNDPQCRQSIRALLVTGAVYGTAQFVMSIGLNVLCAGGGTALQAFCQRFSALALTAANTLGEALDELVICYLMRAFQRKAHPQGPVKLRVSYVPSGILNLGNWLCVTSPTRMMLFYNVTLMGTMVSGAYRLAERAEAATQRVIAAMSCATLGSLYAYFHVAHWRRPLTQRDILRRARRAEAYAIARRHDDTRRKLKADPAIFSFWLRAQPASLPKP